MSCSRKESVNKSIRDQFVACHWQPIWCFQLLEDNPTLLETDTISLLQEDAYKMLLPNQPKRFNNLRVESIISAAALLEICAGKPQTEVQKQIQRFVNRCEKTNSKHLEHAIEICDRIEQKFDVNKEDAALRKMSLVDGKAALDHTTQPSGEICTIRERFREYLGRLQF